MPFLALLLAALLALPAGPAHAISLDDDQEDLEDAIEAAQKAGKREDFAEAQRRLEEAQRLGVDRRAVEAARTDVERRKAAYEQRLAEEKRRQEEEAARRRQAEEQRLAEEKRRQAEEQRRREETRQASAPSSGSSGGWAATVLDLYTGSWCGQGHIRAKAVREGSDQELECCGWGNLGGKAFYLVPGTYRLSFAIRTCSGKVQSWETGEIPLVRGKTTRVEFDFGHLGSYYRVMVKD